MFTNWYEIKGMTKELYEAWKDDLRKDIIIWEENGGIKAQINLNILEAFRLSRQMERNNEKQNYYKLMLAKI